MFILLEVDEITDKWKQVPGTSTFESAKEAQDYGEENELFDTIIVEFVRFI